MARGDSDSDYPYGMNEVDDFAQKRGEILLNKSTLRDRRNNYDSDEELADNGEEEIMGIDESDEDSESDHEVKDSDVYRKVFGKRMESVESDEELSEEDGNLEWGATKNDYYGADELDDDDEAKEIEKEALRQQKLNMEELHMQDFLDDEVENEWVKKAKDYDMEKFNESTNMKTTGDGSMEDIKNIFNMTEEAKKTFIQTAFPEFFPLSIEYTNLNNKLNDLNKLENSNSHVISIKKSALNAYIGVIASYFAIFLNELKNNLEDFHTMKDHPVMESILTLKEIWRQANELPNEMEIDSEEEDGEQEFGSMDQEQDSGVGENEDEDAEVSEIDEDILAATMPIDNEGGSSEEEDGEQDSEDDGEEEDEEENDFGIDLTASRVVSSKDAKKKKTAIVDNDFLEADINEVDASEKKARKKTLRFYTSKIDQADLKKLERFKGDDDVPYKERLFERQQRLLEEARKRGLKTGGSDEHDLDNNDMDSDDEKIASKINSQGENDYYNQIKAGRVHKKETREKAHNEAVQAAKEGKLAELAEDIGEDGKRAINYQILKNKGLTPKRHKDNRNSRVKKRKKYEKAQKKLKSVRAVYSGGQSGSYEGEKTGIKKNLVKSVKFRS